MELLFKSWLIVILNFFIYPGHSTYFKVGQKVIQSGSVIKAFTLKWGLPCFKVGQRHLFQNGEKITSKWIKHVVLI